MTATDFTAWAGVAIGLVSLILGIVNQVLQVRDRRTHLAVQSWLRPSTHLVSVASGHVPRPAMMLRVVFTNDGAQPVFVRDVWLEPRHSGTPVQLFSPRMFGDGRGSGFTLLPQRYEDWEVDGPELARALEGKGYKGIVRARVVVVSETERRYRGAWADYPLAAMQQLPPGAAGPDQQN